MLAKCLYDRLKTHPAMIRHVGKVRNAPSSGAEMQTFDWLWGKLDQCIHESQQEANAISIHERLRKVSGMTVPRVVRMGRATGSYTRMARMAKVNPTPVPNQVINGGSMVQ